MIKKAFSISVETVLESAYFFLLTEFMNQDYFQY